MKYKSKMYAVALVGALLDQKDTTTQKKILERFFVLLQKNGDIKKAREIVSLAEDVYCKKTGTRKVVLESARQVAIKNITKEFIREGDLLEEKINPALIAGLKIIINKERQLDFSLSHTIEKIFN